MIFVVGGVFQGKRAFAEDRFQIPSGDWADGAVCSREDIFRAAAVDHFHLLVKRLLKEGKNVDTLAGELIARNPGAVVLADEIGCGVVPIDAFERIYRDEAGRAAQTLAAFSEKVYRVYCGIGTCIKGGDGDA